MAGSLEKHETNLQTLVDSLVDLDTLKKAIDGLEMRANQLEFVDYKFQVRSSEIPIPIGPDRKPPWITQGAWDTLDNDQTSNEWNNIDHNFDELSIQEQENIEETFSELMSYIEENSKKGEGWDWDVLLSDTQKQVIYTAIYDLEVNYDPMLGPLNLPYLDWGKDYELEEYRWARTFIFLSMVEKYEGPGWWGEEKITPEQFGAWLLWEEAASSKLRDNENSDFIFNAIAEKIRWDMRNGYDPRLISGETASFNPYYSETGELDQRDWQEFVNPTNANGESQADYLFELTTNYMIPAFEVESPTNPDYLYWVETASDNVNSDDETGIVAFQRIIEANPNLFGDQTTWKRFIIGNEVFILMIANEQQNCLLSSGKNYSNIIIGNPD